MTYSITFAMHPHVDKNGLSKVNIQVIFNRMKVYAPTPIKVAAKNWNGEVILLKNKSYLNATLNEHKNDIEKRLLDAMRQPDLITKDILSEIVKGHAVNKEMISDYILYLVDELKGKFSPGSLNHYKTIAAKLDHICPNVKFQNVSVQWMQQLEKQLRQTGLDGNTVQSNMKMVKGILNKARLAGLVKREQFEDYKVPKYVQKLVEYLTEDELTKIGNLVQLIGKPGHKLAGYYFLLSCYSGYRLSDIKAFDYDKMVSGKNIILRTKKNMKIVSIPIHSRLKQILDFVKVHPLNLSEQKIREYVKDICSLAGITKNVKFHTGRHSWAMLLMSKGFSAEEVAETIGDTLEVAKIYAQIHNESLSKKILNKLK